MTEATEHAMGCSPWGHKESDMTERQSTHSVIWCSSGQDSVLLMRGAWVQSLVRELEPTCHN